MGISVLIEEARAGSHITEKETLKQIGKDLFNLHKDILMEQANSPIPMWNCGNPLTIVPRREDFQDIKEFHMTVSAFKVHYVAWMHCATDYIYLYPLAVEDWSRQLLKDNEVIIQ